MFGRRIRQHVGEDGLIVLYASISITWIHLAFFHTFPFTHKFIASIAHKKTPTPFEVDVCLLVDADRVE